MNLMRNIESFKFKSEFWKDRLINLEAENEQSVFHELTGPMAAERNAGYLRGGA